MVKCQFLGRALDKENTPHQPCCSGPQDSTKVDVKKTLELGLQIHAHYTFVACVIICLMPVFHQYTVSSCRMRPSCPVLLSPAPPGLWMVSSTELGVGLKRRKHLKSDDKSSKPFTHINLLVSSTSLRQWYYYYPLYKLENRGTERISNLLEIT